MAFLVMDQTRRRAFLPAMLAAGAARPSPIASLVARGPPLSPVDAVHGTPAPPATARLQSLLYGGTTRPFFSLRGVARPSSPRLRERCGRWPMTYGGGSRQRPTSGGSRIWTLDAGSSPPLGAPACSGRGAPLRCRGEPPRGRGPHREAAPLWTAVAKKQ